MKSQIANPKMKQNNSTEFSGHSFNNVYNKTDPPPQAPQDPKSAIFPGFPEFSVSAVSATDCPGVAMAFLSPKNG